MSDILNDVPESHRDLLRRTLTATLTTIDAKGRPRSTVVWYFVDSDGQLKGSITSNRRQYKDLRGNRNCDLFIIDFEDPLRTLEVRAAAELIADPDNGTVRKLAKAVAEVCMLRNAGVFLRLFRLAQGRKDFRSECTARVDLHSEGRDLVSDQVARRTAPVDGDPVDRGALPVGLQGRGGFWCNAHHVGDRRPGLKNAPTGIRDVTHDDHSRRRPKRAVRTRGDPVSRDPNLSIGKCDGDPSRRGGVLVNNGCRAGQGDGCGGCRCCRPSPTGRRHNGHGDQAQDCPDK